MSAESIAEYRDQVVAVAVRQIRREHVCLCGTEWCSVNKPLFHVCPTCGRDGFCIATYRLRSA